MKYAILGSVLDSKELLRLQSPDDGNCFYHSLAAWMRMNSRLLGGDEPTHMTIREAVAEYKIARAVVDYEVGAIDTDEFPTLESYIAGLEGMKKPNTWFSNLGDTVVDGAAIVLGINIHVINWDYDSNSIAYEYTAEVPGALETIHILRVGFNHYDLLMPKVEYTGEAAAIWSQIQAGREVAATAKSKGVEGKIRKLVAKAKKQGIRGVTIKGLKGMVNAGTNINSVAVMLNMSPASSSNNVSPPAAARKKTPAATRKKDKFANLYNKGLTKNNIEELRAFGMPNENMLEYNIKNLFGLLGRTAPVSSPNTSPNTVKPAVLRRSARHKPASSK